MAVHTERLKGHGLVFANAAVLNGEEFVNTHLLGGRSVMTTMTDLCARKECFSVRLLRTLDAPKPICVFSPCTLIRVLRHLRSAKHPHGLRRVAPHAEERDQLSISPPFHETCAVFRRSAETVKKLSVLVVVVVAA